MAGLTPTLYGSGKHRQNRVSTEQFSVADHHQYAVHAIIHSVSDGVMAAGQQLQQYSSPAAGEPTTVGYAIQRKMDHDALLGHRPTAQQQHTEAAGVQHQLSPYIY